MREINYIKIDKTLDELERDFIGVEIAEKYFAIVKNRIENTKIQGELLLWN